MEHTTQPRESGSYTANLLGNIRSHLAGLQGYDVMALELIQNADDAEADAISFDITDHGLFVRNSSRFSYCGDLREHPCRFMAEENYSCDYHRIVDVGSGGKLFRGDNIGRFGIGFVSTYQVTDRPEIRSTGIKLTLRPEEGKWTIDPCDEHDGTSFFLPWADDPRTDVRRELGVSHISLGHIEQLSKDFEKVLRQSLLFLRHVKKAEVRRNGKLVTACDLERSEHSDLIVSFRPSGEVEQWYILRADASDAARQLFIIHPSLETLKRSTKISIGLRVDPGPLTEGLLYAFLPTEQPTGLPLHINADFFPEPDRKALIFAGHQHQQAWNEMLVKVAAAELARDPERLLKTLGHVQLWRIISHAYDLTTRSTGHPACFKRFWEKLKVTGGDARITLAHNGSYQRPRDVFRPRTQIDDAQASALLELGGLLTSEDLRPFDTAMGQLGAPVLTLDGLVRLMEGHDTTGRSLERTVDDHLLEEFYQPLWRIVDAHLPEEPSKLAIQGALVLRLKALPFVVTEKNYVVAIAQAYRVAPSQNGQRVAELLPRLAISTHKVQGSPKLEKLISVLDLNVVTSHIAERCIVEPIEDFIDLRPRSLRDLYALLADLDQISIGNESVYETLRRLPIWLSSKGLVPACQALLPGDFTDPTGHADLLDLASLTESSKGFLSLKLGVKTQTIQAFVETVLPSFFSGGRPANEAAYDALITELSRHPALVNDDRMVQILGHLAMVPTKDGGWARPRETYRRTDDLAKVLGEADHLWLDTERLPDTRSVRTFIESLGIRQSPMARHLVDRMLFLAGKYKPSEEARRACAEAFYALCDNYKEWREKPFLENAIADLRDAPCFPAEGDEETWHTAASLYAPYRADAFRSQAKILDFRNTGRLETELLEELKVSINPESNLVIGHLKHCVAKSVPPHVSAYQVLNERAQHGDPQIAALAETPCLYVESQKMFVRPNRVYWLPQQLGRFALTAPGSYESFKPLFTALGVKSAPDGHDFSEILLEIVGEHFEQGKPVTGSDRSVYDRCLEGLSEAFAQDSLSDADLRRLQEATSVLNIKNEPTHPDEILLQDSEWHAGFFDGELDRALCKPAAELWPLMQRLGVRRLSESARVALDFVDGPEVEETSLALQLVERAEILGRLLYDKPTPVQLRVQSALHELRAVSRSVVRIQAFVELRGSAVPGLADATPAFYDIDTGRLILTRPVSDSSWMHVLSTLFHALMPQESGNEIAKLALMVEPLLGRSVEDAHAKLTAAGIPSIGRSTHDEDGQDLTSPVLGPIVEAPLAPDLVKARPPAESPTNGGAGPGNEALESCTTTLPFEGGGILPMQRLGEATGSYGVHPPDQSGSELGGDWEGSTVSDYRRPGGGRAKHKEKWNRRLLSYVERQLKRPHGAEADGSIAEHNLGVEAVARAAVCSYEKSRGRVPEQMALTHPGYDIISRDPQAAEERFIEVKGISGEWSKTGVGLSRLQFSNAQDLGDTFWLYVVEFVGDAQHMRVHPIQSPAMKVAVFMFDGNWRDVVIDERANPALAFIPGARLEDRHAGRGRVLSVDLRGSTRVMEVQFEDHGVRRVTLNLENMKIIEDQDGDDDS